jgi:hypothetical protein
MVAAHPCPLQALWTAHPIHCLLPVHEASDVFCATAGKGCCDPPPIIVLVGEELECDRCGGIWRIWHGHGRVCRVVAKAWDRSVGGRDGMNRISCFANHQRRFDEAISRPLGCAPFRACCPELLPAAAAITRSDLEFSECRYAWLFYPDRIAYRPGTGVHRSRAFLLPSACLFRTVFLSWYAYLRPTASHRCPSWSPWVAENHVGSSRLSHENPRHGLSLPGSRSVPNFNFEQFTGNNPAPLILNIGASFPSGNSNLRYGGYRRRIGHIVPHRVCFSGLIPFQTIGVGRHYCAEACLFTVPPSGVALPSGTAHRSTLRAAKLAHTPGAQCRLR